jgi:hypothetical protein
MTPSDTYYRQMDADNGTECYNKWILRALFLTIPFTFSPILIANKGINNIDCGSLYTMLWTFNASSVICIAMTIGNISCNIIKVFGVCYSAFFIIWGIINSKYVMNETLCEQLIYKNYEPLSMLVFIYYMVISLLLTGNIIMFILFLCSRRRR